MPGVPEPSFLERLHSSAREVLALEEHVKLDKASAAQLGQALAAKAEEVKAAAHGRLAFPIKFDDLEAEVNFLAIYHLLQFGSGWDPQLRAKHQRDAAEMLQYGLLGMHISGQRMDSLWMKAFSLFQVHNFFNLDSHEDQAVPNLPGVTMSRPGPLQPLVVAIQQTLAETGEALGQEGCRTLGSKILGFLDEAAASGRPPLASELVEELCSSLPGFQDRALVDGRRLEFARKAQALVGTLMARFGEKDKRFAFVDVAGLAADSGAVLPAVLRAKGVLQLSPELMRSIDAGEELPAGPQERALRAAAIAAVDAVVEAAGGVFTAQELGSYLALLAEEGQELHGTVHKHFTKSKAY